MKKYLFALPLFFVLFGCQSKSSTMNDDEVNNVSLTESSQVENPKGDGASLIVYFSQPTGMNTDVNTGASVLIREENERLGLVEQVAQWIQEETQADIFRIQVSEPYSDDIEQVMQDARTEEQEDARPALSSQITNLGQYDTIYLGYPIWWYDLPMPVYRFLEENDLAGKTIILFNMHGGSRLLDTVETIQELQPEAEVRADDALTISRNDVADSQQDVINWVNGL